MKKAVLFGLLPLFFLLSSCTARIQGRIEADSSGVFTVSAGLEPRIAALIRSLTMAAGQGTPGDLILNGEALAASMAAAPGIASVSFKNTAPAAVEGLVGISRIGDFLSPAGAKGDFITFDPALAGKSGGRLGITLSRETGPGILSLLSPEVSDYLVALMAPIATGEVLSRSEYLSLVASIYGKPAADEISAAEIRASIDFPGAVNSVKGGTWSGKRVEFTIPLPDLLVLETPLHYEVSWDAK
jgi:hypothetical protein